MAPDQSYRTVTDTDWQQRVAYALIRQALAIYGENPATAGHAARAILATKVLAGPAGYASVFALVIGCDDAFLALTVPNGVALALASMETRIAAAWNAVAGA